jgi:hypothetical protein
MNRPIPRFATKQSDGDLLVIVNVPRSPLNLTEVLRGKPFPDVSSRERRFCSHKINLGGVHLYTGN